MNVIFIDFDGTLYNRHDEKIEDIEKRIKILSDICHQYNCKVVIESAYKDLLDEETLEVIEGTSWLVDIMNLFKKYEVEVIGRTPTVKKYTSTSKSSYHPIWKEYEILLYLMRHPEIEHFCIFDDDDYRHLNGRGISDLERVKEYLITMQPPNPNIPYETVLQESDINRVEDLLKKENKVRRLLLKYKKTLNK